MDRFASIDLGTNTFHLLIVDYSNNEFKEVYRKRIFVNLAEEKIDFINEDIQQRVFKAIALFKSKIDKFQVSKYSAIGTSALREAQNGLEILSTIKNNYNIDVELVSGEREADLIFKGVNLSLDLSTDNYLIMDIGGGSIEFIIVEDGQKTWVQSFQIGITVLYHLLKNPDPMTDTLYKELKHILDLSLNSMFEVLNAKNINGLIGASGSFDVIKSIMKDKVHIDKCILIKRNQQYYEILKSIMYSTIEERAKMHNIPPSRKKLLPIALFIIEYIMDKIKTPNLYVSPFALKEGVLSELMPIKNSFLNRINK